MVGVYVMFAKYYNKNKNFFPFMLRIKYRKSDFLVQGRLKMLLSTNVVLNFVGEGPWIPLLCCGYSIPSKQNPGYTEPTHYINMTMKCHNLNKV